jgi:hypothetical protein
MASMYSDFDKYVICKENLFGNLSFKTLDWEESKAKSMELFPFLEERHFKGISIPSDWLRFYYLCTWEKCLYLDTDTLCISKPNLVTYDKFTHHNNGEHRIYTTENLAALYNPTLEEGERMKNIICDTYTNPSKWKKGRIKPTIYGKIHELNADGIQFNREHFTHDGW